MNDILRPIEKDDDIYTLKEWIAAVHDGHFIDYDGMGNFATATHKEGGTDYVYPSDIIGGKQIPGWVTHIVWYNR